jgi:hypothetical protein
MQEECASNQDGVFVRLYFDSRMEWGGKRWKEKEIKDRIRRLLCIEGWNQKTGNRTDGIKVAPMSNNTRLTGSEENCLFRSRPPAYAKSLSIVLIMHEDGSQEPNAQTTPRCVATIFEEMGEAIQDSFDQFGCTYTRTKSCSLQLKATELQSSEFLDRVLRVIAIRCEREGWAGTIQVQTQSSPHTSLDAWTVGLCSVPHLLSMGHCLSASA